MSEQITTAEELDALPEGSVVLDGAGRASQRGGPGTLSCWVRTGDVPGRIAERVLRYGPVTVLYRPDAVADTSPHAEPTPVGDALIERLCEVQHDAYEVAAVREGWQTQAASRRPWSEVPEANKATMRASMRAVLAEVAKEAKYRFITDTSPHAEPTPVGDLRERVAQAINGHYADSPEPDEDHYECADAVLAVVDPDGLRAEVERLRGALTNREATLLDRIASAEQISRDVMAERDAALAEVERLRATAQRNDDLATVWREDGRRAATERDAAVREAAALRAGVEALAERWLTAAGPGTEADRVLGPQKVSVEFAARSLRALLADPTKTDG